MEYAVAFIALAVMGYALVEHRLVTTVVTGPMIFMTLGFLAGNRGFDIIDPRSLLSIEAIDAFLVATLTLVLFTDASALHFSSWRRDADIPGRLLGIGLPLTIAFGWVVAALLFTDLSVWEAGMISVVLAPTDAALGQAVISNPRVPERVRVGLNIESGLNDGVALPILLILIAVAEQAEGSPALARIFVEEIVIAVAVGLVVGVVGGRLLVRSKRSGWLSPTWSRISVVAMAALCYGFADPLGGSGFIAAFVGGLFYGRTTDGELGDNEQFADDFGKVTTQIAFLVFGAVGLGFAFERLTWQVVVMAVLALTVVRMIPVAISMVGARLSVNTVVYMGWFGPRGIATVIFALVVVTSTTLPGTEVILTVALITMALSVFAHGMTSNPGSERYANWYASHPDVGDMPESEDVENVPFRGRVERPLLPTRGT